MIQHILPANDLYIHSEDIQWGDSYGRVAKGMPPFCPCKCCPIIKKDGAGGFIIIHSSYDGREGVEIVKEILKIKS